MPIYNLTEYSDNYYDSLGSLWEFKRDDVVNNADVTNGDNDPSFKYKVNLITNTEASGTKNGVKKAVPLQYLCNFWRSLETALINCRVELSFKQIENYVLSTDAVGANANVTHADSATFKIIDAKLYIPVATLSTLSAEDNERLANQSDVYWSKDKMIDNKKVKTSHANEQKPLKELFDSSYQGVKRLFVLAYDDTEGDNQVSVILSKNIPFRE